MNGDKKKTSLVTDSKIKGIFILKRSIECILG